MPYALLRKRLVADRHFNFMRGELERILYEQFTGRAAIRFNTSVAALRTTARRVEVRLSDGATESVDLLIGLIGADGVHSSVRRLAFGPPATFTRELGCHMATFFLHTAGGPVPNTCQRRGVRRIAADIRRSCDLLRRRMAAENIPARA